jgi:hypothetical protein
MEKWARKENNGFHQGKHNHKADLNVLIYNDFLFLKFFNFKKTYNNDKLNSRFPHY